MITLAAADGKHLAKPLARHAAHDDEAPRPHLAMIGGASARAQDRRELGIIRSWIAHQARRDGPASEEGVDGAQGTLLRGKPDTANLRPPGGRVSIGSRAK